MIEFYNGQKVKYKGDYPCTFLYVGMCPRIKGYLVVCHDEMPHTGYISIPIEEMEAA